ncbi:9fa7dc9d-c9b1-4661-8b18-c38a57a814d8 [Thermothielavioides terrestris]|uniref:9fa7dc9d-c9b1-4661-8b18-c38a57a814d8 n=1 Tax=Thermothielavioides terrestris TaxID=2587410 RepID=A0A3S4BHI0_9PEZI|nr:9fa7dc9d-c9b1-4661-8b18-c38a57a814d8 [Thermothielavioides terrestris]
MSSPPVIKAGGGSDKPQRKPKPKRVNNVRRIMHREQRIRERSVASSPPVSAPAAPAAPATSSGPVCNNPQCEKSDVRDGVCQNCGRVMYESNIVAEITFGETASGAAVVHGSYLAADQGSIRPTASGPAFRRVPGAGGSEARERSLREAKQIMNQFAHQLRIPLHLVDKAHRLYRAASTSNFIQGRRKHTVAAVCLYAICRKEDHNKVMLIDLADIIKTDVFLLGKSYKDLLNSHPNLKEGTKPIIIEDLIFRFASKLEFLHDTNKVALSAVRIAQRMRHDNITHGRRPAGICGAALIMAARAHNYRRTVREVVYIAKVTMATLQERMEEFANVPAAQMTVAQFQEAESFPETSHDPPFVYKQTKEWQEKHPKRVRKRKRKANEVDPATSPSGEGSEEQGAAKRQKLDSNESQPPSVPIDPALQEASTEGAAPSAPEPHGECSSAPAVNDSGAGVRIRIPTAEELSIANAATADVENQLEELAGEFGDPQDEEVEEELDPSSEMAMAAAQGIQVPGMENMKIKPRKDPSTTSPGDGFAAGKGRRKPKLTIDEAWEQEENELEQEMQGHLNDPALIDASALVTQDIERRREQRFAAQTDSPAITAAETTTNQLVPDPSDPRFTPISKVSDDPIVHEDEFKDDPEVMFCKLTEKDVMMKEMIWVNHNKDYLRKMQQKIFEAKTSKGKPVKQRSGRARKPRIGEGQATPASSAAEAAQNMLRTRAISTKLDYQLMGNLFEFTKGGPGSTYGGASSVGSRSALPSSAGSDVESDDEGGSDADEAQNQTSAATAAAAAATAREKAARALAPPDEEDEDEGEGDQEFGGEDDFQDGEEEFDPFGDNGGEDY